MADINLMLPKSVPVKYHARIEHWDDERDIGNSLIVSLAKGYEFGIDKFECRHVDGFDSIADALYAVKNAIACTCDECK